MCLEPVPGAALGLFSPPSEGNSSAAAAAAALAAAQSYGHSSPSEPSKAASAAQEGGEGDLGDASAASSWASRHLFRLDRAFGEGEATAAVYADAVAPLSMAALGGFSACVLAYGPRGGGKTHTLLGGGAGRNGGGNGKRAPDSTSAVIGSLLLASLSSSKAASSPSSSSSSNDPGLVQRAVRDLFACAAAAGRELRLGVSAVEVGEGPARDLLASLAVCPSPPSPGPSPARGARGVVASSPVRSNASSPRNATIVWGRSPVTAERALEAAAAARSAAGVGSSSDTAAFSSSSAAFSPSPSIKSNTAAVFTLHVDVRPSNSSASSSSSSSKELLGSPLKKRAAAGNGNDGEQSCCAALLQFADLPACDAGGSSSSSSISFSSSPPKAASRGGAAAAEDFSSSSLLGGGGACALTGGVAGGHALAALGDVLGALARGAPHVPYRNSALTRMLSATLRPGARASLVLAVPGAGAGGGNGSGGDGAARSARDALEFGLRARAVELGPPRRLLLVGGKAGTAGAEAGDGVSGVPRLGAASQLASGVGAVIGLEGGYSALLAATEAAKMEEAAMAGRTRTGGPRAAAAPGSSSSLPSSPAARRRILPRSPSPVRKMGSFSSSLLPPVPLTSRPEWRG